MQRILYVISGLGQADSPECVAQLSMSMNVKEYFSNELRSFQCCFIVPLRERLVICCPNSAVFSFLTCRFISCLFSVSATEPNFVGSALVRESRNSKDGDDDKIYFFFSERAVELDCDSDLTVARVARVCKVSSDGRDWSCYHHLSLGVLYHTCVAFCQHFDH